MALEEIIACLVTSHSGSLDIPAPWFSATQARSRRDRTLQPRKVRRAFFFCDQFAVQATRRTRRWPIGKKQGPPAVQDRDLGVQPGDENEPVGRRRSVSQASSTEGQLAVAAADSIRRHRPRLIDNYLPATKTLQMDGAVVFPFALLRGAPRRRNPNLSWRSTDGFRRGACHGARIRRTPAGSHAGP